MRMSISNPVASHSHLTLQILLGNPSVLLLDEATFALHSNSERVVQDALDQAAKGRTTISIAYRISRFQGYNRIHFIQGRADY